MNKFSVYGHVRRQTQTGIHTHASCNAVPLVWGSLRLAPISFTVPSMHRVYTNLDNLQFSFYQILHGPYLKQLVKVRS